MMNLRTLQEQRDDSVQWDLGGCCEVEESLYLGLYFAYAIVFWCLSSTSCFKPMRLLSVFIHEISHALACILTGGKVHKVRVEDNEGGVTQHQGGIRLCVIPAGYVGAAFWGGAIVALSGGARLGSTIAAGAIVFSLLLAMCFSPNRIIVCLMVGFTVLFGVALYIEWFVFEPFLGYFTLFFGVFIGYYSVSDIYDDLIKRNAEGSDAQSCHKVLPCCLPRCVGLQFALCALIFQIVGLYLGLVWMFTSLDHSG